MAVTENTYTGNGSTVLYSFTFPYLAATDIKVSINGVLTTAYTLANATTIQFNTAPSNGAAIRIYRSTSDAAKRATFFPGSSIRAADLNEDFDQVLYIAQETANLAASTDASAIQATANTALATSNTALTTANAASVTANGIAGTANTALSNSTTAVSTANAANSTATSALSVANAALPLTGGTMTGSITFSGGQPTGTTSTPGIIQLTDSTSSTSVTTAATPNSVKSTYDAAMLKTGGTFTGDVTLNAQSDLRFADSDSSNWVAFQAPATVASNVTWTLPAADGTDGQKLSTNGSGVLSWTASAPKITYLTSGTSATYTPTTGTKAIYVEVVGAGGGGGGVDGQGAGTGAVGASGGGGGYTAKLITSPAVSYTYTIGAGGSAGSSAAGSGGGGGTSTFTDGTLTLTATGGDGGTGLTATAGNSTGSAGGIGGAGSGGDLNLEGRRAGNRAVASGLVVSLSTSGAAPFFGGGKTTAIGNAGEAGTNYGEGGSAGAVYNVTTNYAGGAGAAGVIRITEFF
jgi:hypothetical protein